jgi:ABC-type molybdate transport system substrate-binding protein
MKSPTAATSIVARIAAASVLLAATIGNGGPASAADINVLSVAAMQSVFKEIAGDFLRTTGHRLVIRYATTGSITERLRRGEDPDLVISSTQSISDLVQEGQISTDSQVTISAGVSAGIPVDHLPSRPVGSLLHYLQGPKAIAAIKAKRMDVD